MALVMFDFDGTITKDDTLFAFTLHAVGKYRFLFGLVYLAIPLILSKSKIISAKRAKEIFLTHFFKNISLDVFNSKCFEFAQTVLPGLIKKNAIDAIKLHKVEGNKIIIVSASPENWIQPWAATFDIDVLATKLSIIDNKLTGSIDGENCNGQEKVNRIIAKYDLTLFDEIIGYGDTKGDLPMLSLAHKKFYRYL